MARSEPLTAMMSSGFLKFKVDYANNKDLPVGEGVHSHIISAGGHMWRIECYPNGIVSLSRGDLSLFLKHMSKSANVKGIFEAFLMDSDGVPSTEATRRTDVFRLAGNSSGQCDNWGWFSFVQRNKLEKKYVTDGHITFICVILVVSDSPICVPSSDIGVHLGSLLNGMEGTDVSFTIDGETFLAHRAVLAACSPVFRAELFGSMAEDKMPSITLQDIASAVLEFAHRSTTSN